MFSSVPVLRHLKSSIGNFSLHQECSEQDGKRAEAAPTVSFPGAPDRSSVTITSIMRLCHHTLQQCALTRTPVQGPRKKERDDRSPLSQTETDLPLLLADRRVNLDIPAIDVAALPVNHHTCVPRANCAEDLDFIDIRALLANR